MSANTATTPDPNQPPVFITDVDNDPSAAINELHALLTTLHSNTCNTFINHSTQINAVQDAVNALPALAPPPTCSIKGTKLSQFSGKVQDVECFLQDLWDDIKLQGSAFARDRQKVLYMVSFCCDTQTAHDWVAGTCVSHPDWFDNFDAFTQGFEAHFRSPNKINEALLHKLQNLKQTSSATSYAARFCEISAALPQEEFFLLNMFFNGLKQEVQHWIYQLPDGKTSSLDDLVTRTIDGDNHLHEWSHSTHPTMTSGFSPKPTTSTSTPTASQMTSGPAPMDLGATRVIRTLDASEKERRKCLGLCTYCGGSHSLDNCQLLKEKNERKAKGLGKVSLQA
ncbi:Retrotransposon-derived protein peg10 [Ceratobasidium sp. 423]|nr:Retrotransposon-derived protein peg10 [Ceratobasidium sp. 423]